MKCFAWPSSKRESRKYITEWKKQARETGNLPSFPSEEECGLYSMPSQPTEDWLDRVVATHPKVFWIEGCEAPRLGDCKIKLDFSHDQN